MTRVAWRKTKISKFFFENREVLLGMLVALIVAAILGGIMYLNLHKQSQQFKDVEFKGLYKNQNPGSYLVLWERNGEIQGKSFFDYDAALSLAEALK